MKKIFTLLLCCVCAIGLMAQNTISGQLKDADTGETLIGATIVLEATQKGTTTDIDGNFKIEDVPNGNQNLLINYVGYQTLTVPINASQRGQLGAIKVYRDEKVLSEVEIIASIATDRRTPVAVTTLKGEEIALKVGNQEYVEILKKTPSIYVTKQGGGFGDSRINVRGFDQRNTAVLINGIPVNDMENGWVFWSNWAGLSDVTSKLQVQRGLGATKLAAPTVGGSINIITNAAELKRKGTISLSVGNDAYLKSAVSYSTGLLENGFAASVQATRTQGDGYVDGTQFSAWSYFLALSKVFNRKHTMSFSAVGAPQWHHQRTFDVRFDEIYLQTYLDKGIKYNHNWGSLEGEEFTWRRNFYHKPKVFLNHYWNINSRTNLKTSAYASFGRGGGTGPRGRLRTPGSVFNSYSGDGEGIYDLNGQVRFDDLMAYNQGNLNNTDTLLQNWGENKNPSEEFNGTYVVTEDGKIYTDSLGNVVSDDFNGNLSNTSNGSGFIRRASMNYHNWYGILSTLTYNLTDEFTLTTGIDGRYYKGEHFRRLENLLGAQGYSTKSDINNQSNLLTEPVPANFGNFFDSTYKDGTVLAYHNDGIVGWAGAFAQLEYLRNDLSAFVSLSGSNQSFRRYDYFNYYSDENRNNISSSIVALEGQAAADQWLEDNPSQQSDWVSILGGTVKAGANYNIGSSNVFVNGGYLSRQPIFDDVFLNFRNDINEDRVNQTIYAFEAGYGLQTKYADVKVNLYNTTWLDKRIDRSASYIPTAPTNNFEFEGMIFNEGEVLTDAYGVPVQRGGNVNFLVNQRHIGGEFEAYIKPIKELTIDLSFSYGDWKYIDDASGTLVDEDLNNTVEVFLPLQKRPIGDAAQTTFAAGLNYKPIDGLRLYTDLTYFGRNYAQFNIAENDDISDSDIRNPALQLPQYALWDGGASYSIPFGEYKISVNVNVNNILNTQYVSDLVTNIPDDPDTEENEFYTRNKGYFGFGTTWNTGLRFHF